MKRKLEKFIIFAIHLFCVVVLIEIVTNYCSFFYLFPIKNATSYGYITKKGSKTIVPLNKYHSRLQAQVALPFELLKSTVTDKDLKKTYSKDKKKYGFKDKNGKLVIGYTFESAQEFVDEYAIVSIKQNGRVKYGTIDKMGYWVIEPKYDYMCPFLKYYTRACVDKKHCGVIDKYGNEITLMTYKTDRLHCSGQACSSKLCTIGKDSPKVSCNYFL